MNVLKPKSTLNWLCKHTLEQGRSGVSQHQELSSQMTAADEKMAKMAGQIEELLEVVGGIAGSQGLLQPSR